VKHDPRGLIYTAPFLRVLYADTDGRLHTWMLQKNPATNRLDYMYEGALTKSELAALIIRHSPSIPEMTEWEERSQATDDLTIDDFEI